MLAFFIEKIDILIFTVFLWFLKREHERTVTVPDRSANGQERSGTVRNGHGYGQER